MTSRLLGAKLNLLSVREVLNAQDRELSDGGGLFLRYSGQHTAWVFRYTRPSGSAATWGSAHAHATTYELQAKASRRRAS